MGIPTIVMKYFHISQDYSDTPLERLFTEMRLLLHRFYMDCLRLQVSSEICKA